MMSSIKLSSLETVLSNDALMWVTLKDAFFKSIPELSIEQCNAAATVAAELMKQISNDETLLIKLWKDAELYQ